MKTLRKEAIEIVESILIPALSDNPQTQEAIDYAKKQSEKVIDALIELRGFYFLNTDEEKQEYRVKVDLEQSDIAWTIAAGQKVTQKLADKQAEVYKFEEMICAQLARLPYNFEGDRTQEQEGFRKFLKAQRKLGRELEVWVNWWMSDEWRVANPPWNLTAIKTKWLQAFPKVEEKRSVDTDASGAPITY